MFFERFGNKKGSNPAALNIIEALSGRIPPNLVK